MEYTQTRTSSQQVMSAISVFGQTWQFTKPAISALNLYGLGTKSGLKALIIKSGSSSGIAEGIHEIIYQGVNLQLIVSGNQVLVDDPYIQ